ncbi:hypothetical protein K474DRAFT_1662846 [Panus rudis PR-1116 ss-1]|nr:hypothetical protein K474DRAFT_1662846 [Panus rudis PR-1116 ss-1]
MVRYDTEFRHSRPGPASHLNNSMTYRTFHGCPSQSNISSVEDDGYFIDGNPVRHWCLMAEIAQVKVVNGEVVVLAVAANDEGGERGFITITDKAKDGSKLSESKRITEFKEGHTIVVLYPFHGRMHDPAYEDPDKTVWKVHVKKHKYFTIFPVSLDSLYEAQARISGRARGQSFPCNEPSCSKYTNLQACSACHTIQYCSKEHQVADWPKHKEQCKSIQIVGWFHKKNWAKSSPPFEFVQVSSGVGNPFRS